MPRPNPPRTPVVPTASTRALLGEHLALEFGDFRPLARLWGGFGGLFRTTGNGTPLVVKLVDLERTRPSDRSTARKRRSYLVEETFYRTYSPELSELVPRFYGSLETESFLAIVLEDLDASGFDADLGTTTSGVDGALRWLARFHARTLGRSPKGLWDRGGYFHLATRPDEFARLPEGALRRHAAEFDRRLGGAAHQAWLHGDAKPENFRASRENPRAIRAVDFQYVGPGPGIVDVAYLANSALPPHATLRESFELRDRYLSYLAPLLGDDERDLVLEEWRELYVIAWADFARFLAGWAPGTYDSEPLMLAHLDLAVVALLSSPGSH